MDDMSEIASASDTPGEQLRLAREALGLSLRDIAAATRQSQDTLTALESMNTAAMPANIARMQARIYAQFLNLSNAESLASAYTLQPCHIEGAATHTGRTPLEDRVLVRAPLFGLVAALAVMLGIGLIWISDPAPDISQDPLAVSSRVQLPINPNVLRIDNLAQTNSPELSVKADRRAWIEVRGSDGTVFRSRIMRAGETYFPRLNASWSLTTQDAGAFSVYLDDHFVTRLGADDQAIYSRNVDEISQQAQDILQGALAERENSAPYNR